MSVEGSKACTNTYYQYKPVRHVLMDYSAAFDLAADDCELEVGTELMAPQYWAFYLQKDSPLTSKLNAALLYAREQLQLAQIHDTYFGNHRSVCGAAQRPSLGATLGQMSGVFVLIAMFAVGSFLLHSLDLRRTRVKGTNSV